MLGNFMCLTEQSSTGKSGSFFYYTADGRFMLKTISHEEFYFLHRILKDYYFHLKNNKDSLITRFYGMYKMKYLEGSSTKRLYFIIMANVFAT